MHYLDANKTAGEKARQQLHKNAASNMNKSWRQHTTKHQLYGHLPPITKTIQFGWTRHAGHCCRTRDVLISDGLLWTPTYGRAKAGWPARIYMQQLCEDTGCSPEDLPEVMNDRVKEGHGYLCWRHDMMIMIYIVLICAMLQVSYKILIYKINIFFWR